MSAVVLELPKTPKQAAGDYCAAGWRLCQIPSGQKGPTVPGWNTPEKAIASGMQLFDCEFNLGLLHSLSGTCSIDLDQMDLAIAWFAERGVDLQQLLDADDAVQIVSGRPNSGKLLYKLSPPLPSKKVVLTVDGMRKVALEFRSMSDRGLSVQDVLPPSKLADGREYHWAGKGAWKRLPVLPAGILSVWKGLLDADKEPRYHCVPNGHPASLDEIASAVSACNPDSDRSPWVRVGMAAKKELGDDGFELWNEWSKRSDKYPGEAEMSRQWASFKNDHPNPITIATVFRMAHEAGWKRPAPDLARLFAAVEKSGNIKTPEQVLKELFPPTPRLDTTVLPQVLADYVNEVAWQTGCDPVVSALAGLVAISAVADKESEIYVNSTFREKPIIRAMTIGLPAEKKTPGSVPMFAPVRQLEAEDGDRHEVEKLLWLGKEARHLAQVKALREWSADPARMPNDVQPTVDKLPPEPEPLRLIVKDATSQKVANMLQHRPRGLTVVMDEAMNWLANVTSQRGGDNPSFWTESYGGGSYAFDRVGKGSMPIPNCAVSAYGNCQPDVLAKYLPLLAIDGGHARFIFGALNGGGTDAGFLDDIPDCLSSRNSYTAMIRSVYLAPKLTYWLTAEAREEFTRWNSWATGAAKAARRAGKGVLYEAAVGKLSGLVLRIALLFHMAVDPMNDHVQHDSVKRAILFVRDFVIPQYDYIDGLSVGSKVQQWLVTYILKHCDKTDRLSLSEIARALEKNKRFSFDRREANERVTDAMDDLATLAWTGRVEVAGAKTIWWALNPHLKTRFADEITTIKAEVAEYGFNKMEY